MKLQPVGRNVLVKTKLVEEKINGLIVPGANKDEPLVCTILAHGSQCEFGIKEGDKILISPYAGAFLKGGTAEEPHKLINEKDIIGILQE